MNRELQTYRIIKNNLVFLVVFTILLLGYIVFLCYEIYMDSKIKEVPYISACPDYWTLSNDGNKAMCIDRLKLHNNNKKFSTPQNTQCNSSHNQTSCFNTQTDAWSTRRDLSEALKKKCNWAKKYKVSWDSLESGNIC
jgi:hypothetical protein